MAGEKVPQPTERTPTGYEVPVPDRREFFGNLKKVAEPEKPGVEDEDPSPPHGDPPAEQD
jgi:hypothetical protein